MQLSADPEQNKQELSHLSQVVAVGYVPSGQNVTHLFEYKNYVDKQEVQFDELELHFVQLESHGVHELSYVFKKYPSGHAVMQLLFNK